MGDGSGPRDDVVGELGVGGHTVVRGWAWPVGCQSSSAGQPEAGGVARGCQSGNPGQWQGGEATPAYYYYCLLTLICKVHCVFVTKNVGSFFGQKLHE